MWALLTGAFAWFIRAVVVKAAIALAVIAAIAYMMPIVWGYVSPFVGVSGLNSAFGGISDGVYWGLYAMRLDYGFPAIIGAYVARFLIRRLPFVG